eukprot:PhM_4_TR4414/c0_g1_i1/m.36858
MFTSSHTPQRPSPRRPPSPNSTPRRTANWSRTFLLSSSSSTMMAQTPQKQQQQQQQYNTDSAAPALLSDERALPRDFDPTAVLPINVTPSSFTQYESTVYRRLQHDLAVIIYNHIQEMTRIRMVSGGKSGGGAAAAATSFLLSSLEQHYNRAVRAGDDDMAITRKSATVMRLVTAYEILAIYATDGASMASVRAILKNILSELPPAIFVAPPQQSGVDEFGRSQAPMSPASFALAAARNPHAATSILSGPENPSSSTSAGGVNFSPLSSSSTTKQLWWEMFDDLRSQFDGIVLASRSIEDRNTRAVHVLSRTFDRWSIDTRHRCFRAWRGIAVRYKVLQRKYRQLFTVGTVRLAVVESIGVWKRYTAQRQLELKARTVRGLRDTKLTGLEREIAILRSEKASLQASIEEARREKDVVERRIRDLQSSIEDRKARKRVLIDEDLTAQREDFSQKAFLLSFGYAHPDHGNVQMWMAAAAGRTVHIAGITRDAVDAAVRSLRRLLSGENTDKFFDPSCLAFVFLGMAPKVLTAQRVLDAQNLYDLKMKGEAVCSMYADVMLAECPARPQELVRGNVDRVKLVLLLAQRVDMYRLHLRDDVMLCPLMGTSTDLSEYAQERRQQALTTRETVKQRNTCQTLHLLCDIVRASRAAQQRSQPPSGAAASAAMATTSPGNRHLGEAVGQTATHSASSATVGAPDVEQLVRAAFCDLPLPIFDLLKRRFKAFSDTISFHFTEPLLSIAIKHNFSILHRAYLKCAAITEKRKRDAEENAQQKEQSRYSLNDSEAEELKMLNVEKPNNSIMNHSTSSVNSVEILNRGMIGLDASGSVKSSSKNNSANENGTSAVVAARARRLDLPLIEFEDVLDCLTHAGLLKEGGKDEEEAGEVRDVFSEALAVGNTPDGVPHATAFTTLIVLQSVRRYRTTLTELVDIVCKGCGDLSSVFVESAAQRFQSVVASDAVCDIAQAHSNAVRKLMSRYGRCLSPGVFVLGYSGFQQIVSLMVPEQKSLKLSSARELENFFIRVMVTSKEEYDALVDSGSESRRVRREEVLLTSEMKYNDFVEALCALAMMAHPDPFEVASKKIERFLAHVSTVSKR